MNQTGVTKLSPSCAAPSDVLNELHFDGPNSDSGKQDSAQGQPSRLTVIICTFKRSQRVAALLVSLAKQSRIPDEVVLIDASPDLETESVLKRFLETTPKTGISYFRVSGSLAGLTRQRNFALSLVRSDLIAFFDDDVVLDRNCLAEMERVHREQANVVGVGAFIQNQFRKPTAIWRLRRLLGIVPNLTPGRYLSSGMSTPWTFQPPTDELIAADWLSGCAMMWNGKAAQELGFYEQFDGYAMGEDLEFSLRARSKGRLFLAGRARVEHFHDPAGRPDRYRLGYMQVRNNWEIHRRAVIQRKRRHTAWFCYAHVLDGLLSMRDLAHPGRISGTIRNLRGRARAASDILRSTGSKR